MWTNSSNDIEIILNKLNDPNNRQIKIILPANYSIGEVKKSVNRNTGLEVKYMSIQYGKRTLEDKEVIGEILKRSGNEDSHPKLFMTLIYDYDSDDEFCNKEKKSIIYEDFQSPEYTRHLNNIQIPDANLNSNIASLKTNNNHLVKNNVNNVNSQPSFAQQAPSQNNIIQNKNDLHNQQKKFNQNKGFLNQKRHSDNHQPYPYPNQFKNSNKNFNRGNNNNQNYQKYHDHQQPSNPYGKKGFNYNDSYRQKDYEHTYLPSKNFLNGNYENIPPQEEYDNKPNVQNRSKYLNDFIETIDFEREVFKMPEVKFKTIQKKKSKIKIKQTPKGDDIFDAIDEYLGNTSRPKNENRSTKYESDPVLGSLNFSENNSKVKQESYHSMEEFSSKEIFKDKNEDIFVPEIEPNKVVSDQEILISSDKNDFPVDLTNSGLNLSQITQDNVFCAKIEKQELERSLENFEEDDHDKNKNEMLENQNEPEEDYEEFSNINQVNDINYNLEDSNLKIENIDEDKEAEFDFQKQISSSLHIIEKENDSKINEIKNIQNLDNTNENSFKSQIDSQLINNNISKVISTSSLDNLNPKSKNEINREHEVHPIQPLKPYQPMQPILLSSRDDLNLEFSYIFPRARDRKIMIEELQHRMSIFLKSIDHVPIDENFLFYKQKLNLIFDIDATLLHADISKYELLLSEEEEEDEDVIQTECTIENLKWSAKIKFRKGLKEFFESVNRFSTIYLNTMGVYEYGCQVALHLKEKYGIEIPTERIKGRDPKVNVKILKKYISQFKDIEPNKTLILDDTCDVWGDEDSSYVMLSMRTIFFKKNRFTHKDLQDVGKAFQNYKMNRPFANRYRNNPINNIPQLHLDVCAPQSNSMLSFIDNKFVPHMVEYDYSTKYQFHYLKILYERVYKICSITGVSTKDVLDLLKSTVLINVKFCDDFLDYIRPNRKYVIKELIKIMGGMLVPKEKATHILLSKTKREIFEMERRKDWATQHVVNIKFIFHSYFFMQKVDENDEEYKELFE
jgi:hypothetical protein